MQERKEDTGEEKQRAKLAIILRSFVKDLFKVEETLGISSFSTLNSLPYLLAQLEKKQKKRKKYSSCTFICYYTSNTLETQLVNLFT